MACKLLNAARVVGLNAEHAQLELRGCPCKVHGTINGVHVGVLGHESHRVFPRFSSGEHQGNHNVLPGSHVYACSDAENRIKHVSLGVARLFDAPPGIRQSPSPADESSAVGLESERLFPGSLESHAVSHVHRWGILPGRAPECKKRAHVRKRFGLDEQLLKAGCCLSAACGAMESSP